MSARVISIGQCAQMRTDGTGMTIIDVRTPGEFSRLHADGARSMPLARLDAAAIKSLAAPGENLYVICQSGQRAAIACEKMRAAGFSNVWSIAGGTKAWADAGLPVVRGKSGAISLERQVRIAAGSLVLLGLTLAWLVHPALAGLSALVGAGLVVAGISDFCGMALLLAKLPWNQRGAP